MRNLKLISNTISKSKRLKKYSVQKFNCKNKLSYSVKRNILKLNSDVSSSRRKHK